MSISMPVFSLKSKKGIMVLSVIILTASLIVAAVFFVLWCVDQNNKKTLPDLFKLDGSDFKDGLYVQGMINSALGSFTAESAAESGVSTSGDGTSRYYIIPLYEFKSGLIQTNYFIAFKADPMEFSKMDGIVKQITGDHDNYTELHIAKGRIGLIPDAAKPEYYAWFDSNPFGGYNSVMDWCIDTDAFGTSDKDEIRAHFLPVFIDETGTGLAVFWVCLIVAAVAIVTFLLIRKTINTAGNIVSAAD